MLTRACCAVGLTASLASYIGTRAEQQDAAEVTDGAGADFLAVLADGMGGMLMGRECAEKAVSAFVEAFAARRPDEGAAYGLMRAAVRTNDVVVRWAEERGVLEGTGCTLACAAVEDRRLHWVSVGDSRIYLFRRGRLTQLNEDHNLRTRLARTGEPAELYASLNLAALTSFIGVRRLTEIDFSDVPIALAPGDSVLLCSDGLYGSLGAGEICGILSSGADGAASALVEAVAAKGLERQDNATAVVVSLGAAELVGKTTMLLGKERTRGGLLGCAARFLHFIR